MDTDSSSSFSVKTPDSSERICEVCWNDKEADDFPFTPPTLACLHESNTCRGCLECAIATDLAGKGPMNIACPSCNKQLAYEDVLRHGDDRTKERYEVALVRSALQDDDTFVWCSAPGCNAGYVHLGGSDQPIIKCDACGQRTCYTHRAPWHEGITCEEYDTIQETQQRAEREGAQRSNDEALRRVHDNRASEDTIQKTTKPCPKCKRNIEKNGGCAHMQCSVCSYDFCWECLADYQRILRTDNSAHGAKCPFHPDNLQD